eukprot:scaffold42336_cov60-Cyclotella_meneghiniana.AAC.1
MMEVSSPLTVEGKSSFLAMAMATVEMAAISEGLKTFVEGCYTLEGDSPLILTGLSVFRRTESQIESNFDTPGLEKAVDNAAVTMLDALEKEWVEKSSAAQILVNEINPVVAAAKANVDSLAQEKAAVTSNSCSRSDVWQSELPKQPLQMLSRSLREAKAKEKDITNKLKEIQKSFKEWKSKYPSRTRADLYDHGKSVLGPSEEYYKKLFNEEDGDCYDIRQMVEATQIFNPIFLKDMSDTYVCTVLYNLADKLKYVHYNKTITDQLLDNVKKEMPKFVKEAKRDHDLDCIPASKRYKTQLQERIKKKNLPEGSTLD